jgi:hypothetical protein
MLTIVSDNAEVERLLRNMHEMVVARGGWVNPKVKIVSERGELSVHSGLDGSVPEPLFRIPESCFLRIKDFKFAVRNDALVIEDVLARGGGVQAKLLESLIDIYNCNEKVSLHRQASPWFAWSREPAVLERLYRGRRKAKKIARLHGYRETDDAERLLLDSFFGTREFGFALGNTGTYTPVLLPFIDCLNHHFRSPGFQLKKGEGGVGYTLSVENSQPIPGSDECFVRYSQCDALDSYLLFDFVDTDAPFVRSIPVEIPIPEIGTLYVFSQNLGPYKGGLPADVEEIREYVPECLGRNEHGLAVSHLVVPGEDAPTALRGAAEFFIRRACQGMSDKAVRDCVWWIEEDVIRENIAYYTDLASLVKTVEVGMASQEAIDVVERVAESQLRKLTNYRERVRKEG